MNTIPKPSLPPIDSFPISQIAPMKQKHIPKFSKDEVSVMSVYMLILCAIATQFGHDMNIFNAPILQFITGTVAVIVLIAVVECLYRTIRFFTSGIRLTITKVRALI